MKQKELEEEREVYFSVCDNDCEVSCCENENANACRKCFKSGYLAGRKANQEKIKEAIAMLEDPKCQESISTMPGAIKILEATGILKGLINR